MSSSDEMTERYRKALTEGTNINVRSVKARRGRAVSEHFLQTLSKPWVDTMPQYSLLQTSRSHMIVRHTILQKSDKAIARSRQAPVCNLMH